ncbi:MAG TPA: hypothetical protein VGP46_00730 [Acidimicrobiales bacterium]|nr:hypothetical protein [Acidimicrobiales bacterium]
MHPRCRSPRLVVALSVAAFGLVALTASSGTAQAQTLLSGTALVANWGSNNVTPINTHTDTAGSPIGVGVEPDAVAITPNGATAYVANWGSDSVTPITLSTGKAGTPIPVGIHPDGIAIPPDGVTAFVANFGSSSVTPITVATNKAGTPIGVGSHPDAIAADPANGLVWVTSETGGHADLLYIVADKVDHTWATGADPTSLAFTTDGSAVYVTNEGSDDITPVSESTGTLGTPVAVGALPRDIAMSPYGGTAYVSNFGGDTIRAVGLSEGRAGAPVKVGRAPMGLAVTPDGSMIYVANSGSNTVTPVTASDLKPAAAIPVGSAPDAIAVTPGWQDQIKDTWSGGLAQTLNPPALAYFGGELYAIWTDEATDDLMYSVYDGTSWTQGKTISGSGWTARSDLGPSAVADGDVLYVVWKGDTSLDRVWISSFNGTSWTTQDTVSWAANQFAVTAEAPVIASDAGDPFIAWTDGNDAIELVSAKGINQWSAPTQLENSSGVVHTAFSPAMSYSQDAGTLVFAWTNGNETISFQTLGGGTPATIPSALTDASPAIASTGEAIYVAWLGATGNKIFYSATWPDYIGATWVPQETEPQAGSNFHPALATTAFTVTLGWKGTSSDGVWAASALTPY